jgi:hypothetical protein
MMTRSYYLGGICGKRGGVGAAVCFYYECEGGIGRRFLKMKRLLVSFALVVSGPSAGKVRGRAESFKDRLLLHHNSFYYNKQRQTAQYLATCSMPAIAAEFLNLTGATAQKREGLAGNSTHTPREEHCARYTAGVVGELKNKAKAHHDDSIS